MNYIVAGSNWIRLEIEILDVRISDYIFFMKSVDKFSLSTSSLSCCFLFR